jgi:hypothetical protein
MTRRRLIDAQLPDSLREAEELVTGTSPPKRRRAPKRQPVHRVGTLDAPYKRQDDICTVRVNVTLDQRVVARLRRYTLALELEGLRRNEWIEAALEHCISIGFRPPRRSAADSQSSDAATQQRSNAAELPSSDAAEASK